MLANFARERSVYAEKSVGILLIVLPVSAPDDVIAAIIVTGVVIRWFYKIVHCDAVKDNVKEQTKRITGSQVFFQCLITVKRVTS